MGERASNFTFQQVTLTGLLWRLENRFFPFGGLLLIWNLLEIGDLEKSSEIEYLQYVSYY